MLAIAGVALIDGGDGAIQGPFNKADFRMLPLVPLMHLVLGLVGTLRKVLALLTLVVSTLTTLLLLTIVLVTTLNNDGGAT